jgi:hypothetical protein
LAAAENIGMPASRPENHLKSEQLPPLAPENHTCADCALAYAEVSIEATLSELAAATAGFSEDVARTDEGDWDRIASRLPGEDRTARWLVRQAMHEGVHHLGDIRRIGGVSGQLRNLALSRSSPRL